MKTPPMIVHIGYKKEDCLPEIARDCAKAIHMGKGEAALFSFYAAQSTAFKPALNHVAEKTGQSRSQVARNRAALIEHGLAAEERGRLYIDWNRAKLYASLNPALTSKRCRFAPMTLPWKRRPLVTALDLQTEPLDLLCGRLASMTEPEYAALRSRVASIERRKTG